LTTALVIGSRGGIGSSCCCQLLKCGYTVNELTSDNLDLNYPERIFDQDFSNVDVLVNCTGHSRGSYQGFLQNSWQNQLSQITVNYTANLFLLKHYANSRSNGKYVWISTILMDQARPFHSTYAGSKVGSKFAIDLIRQEATHIDILEVKVGPTTTNFRYNNFNGSRTHQQVNMELEQDNSLSPDYVAANIVNAITTNLKEIYIK
jgi:short-subunit dehydrogenase